MNNIKKISTIFLFSFFLSMSFAFADTSIKESNRVTVPNIAGTSENNALVTCGNGPTNATDCKYEDFIQLIQNILKLTFAFAAFIATAMFMYAGFLYLTSMGDTGQIQKAHTVFRRVAMGFLIMFLAFTTVRELLKRLNVSPQAREIINNVIDIGNSSK